MTAFLTATQALAPHLLLLALVTAWYCRLDVVCRRREARTNDTAATVAEYRARDGEA